MSIFDDPKEYWVSMPNLDGLNALERELAERTYKMELT